MQKVLNLKMSMQIVLAGAFTVLISLLSPVAHADDTYTDATETTWGVISSDDGFDKTLTIYKDGDNTGYSDLGTTITYTIEIQCTKRSLSVIVYGDPLGIYPTTDLYGNGTALVKIDSGKISKYGYLEMKDSSGIGFKSDKLLTSAMLKGKRTVSFKIPSSIQADTVATFTIGDMSKYVQRFKSLGCALK